MVSNLNKAGNKDAAENEEEKKDEITRAIDKVMNGAQMRNSIVSRSSFRTDPSMIDHNNPKQKAFENKIQKQ